MASQETHNTNVTCDLDYEPNYLALLLVTSHGDAEGRCCQLVSVLPSNGQNKTIATIPKVPIRFVRIICEYC